MTRLRALWERVSQSLFVLPAVFVVLAALLAELLIAVDVRVDAGDLPRILRSTVESARALLGTVAGATITVAGVVFSIMVVSVQLASSQFSPRILRGYFGDRFQQSVMGLVVGTFTFCMVALRAARAPEDGGEAVIPNLSVAVALVLGVASALAILAFISRTAHMMQIGQLVNRVAGETVELARELDEGWASGGPRSAATGAPRGEPGHVVPAPSSGWVQQVSVGTLLAAIPPGGALRLETRVGWFVAEGTPVCTVWPKPEAHEELESRVHEAVSVGRTRTMQQDVAFGIRQLVDVALRALSPSVNDPTSAQEVIVHLGWILRELLLRELPPGVVAGDDGRSVILPHELTHEGYVRRSFDQIRVAGARQPAVAVYLLEVLGMLIAEMGRAGRPGRVGPLRRQAELVVAGCEAAGPLPDDLERVRRVAARILGSVD